MNSSDDLVPTSKGQETFLGYRLRSLFSRFYSPNRNINQDLLVDKLSLWLTLASFLIAISVFLISPMLAYKWASRPFPGFVIEQTGVISDINGLYWNGRMLGLGFPERVIEINGTPVHNIQEIGNVLDEGTYGEFIKILTQSPDGSTALYYFITLREFPRDDFLRLFWLPYAIGLAFLLLGGWVFLMRGENRSGRAFAFFCISVSISIVLLFDLDTTHVFTATWTIAIAQVGGALFSLAMLFPEEWAPVQRREWVRFLPYLISFILSIWGLAEIHNLSDPWAYIVPWRYSYIYIALGILTFLVMMFYRMQTNPSPVARQQARLILWGSLLAFAPLLFWIFGSSVFNVVTWDPILFLPLLILFPLSISFAILRYRMWDIDVIINHTLVYTALTILLGLTYMLSVLLLQNIFSAFVRNNQLAQVVSALAIVAMFNPMRRRVQDFIDIRFYRRKYDMAKTLAAFSATLRDEVDLTRLTGRLEDIIWDTMQPAHVFSWLATPSGYAVHLSSHKQSGEWLKIAIPMDDPLIPYLRNSSVALALDRVDIDSAAKDRLIEARVKVLLPLVSQGELIGWLSMGKRLSDRDYSSDDLSLLSNLAVQAAPAVRVAQLVQKEQSQALERERFEHELHLAKVIQLALLPKQLPTHPGWRVAAHYQPARAVGGDFYDFVELPGNRLGLVIGDVAGKGVPAAMVMATTRSILRAVALQDIPPQQVLRTVNNQLALDIPPNMFVTCLYAILDLSTGFLRYANAGQNLPYWHSKAGVEELRARGMPLGLMADMDYEEKTMRMDPGDCLMFYSDGLVEAHNSERKMFGSQRLRELILRSPEENTGLIECSLEELADFTGDQWEQEDDITLMVLYRSFSLS